MKRLMISVLLGLMFALKVSLAQPSTSPDLEALIQNYQEVSDELKAQMDDHLQAAYRAYLARFEFLSFEDFRYIYLNNTYPDPGWYPGANCDQNISTQDYCEYRPTSYFFDYAASDLEQFLRNTFIDYCPLLYETYLSRQAPGSSLSLNLFLEAMLNYAPLDPPLGDTEAILKASCAPLISYFERSQLLGSRLSFTETVLDTLIYMLSAN